MGHTHHTTARHVEWRKWMVLVATIWIQAFTGTNFNFPSYSSELKSALEITQVELNYLSMASDFGKLFGWCSGVLLLCFPTWVVVFMAAFLGLFGYGLQWLLVQRLNNRFFWVDESVFPTVVDWRSNAPKDGMPAAGTYSVEAVRALDTHRTPIQKQPKMLLCLVGLSHRYYLGDEVYCVKIVGRATYYREVPVVFFLEAGASDQGTAASEVPPSGEVPAAAAPEPSQVGVAAADPPAATESRKRGRDGSDANAPRKSLRRDHADPRPSGSSHGGKSLAAIQLGLASTASMLEDAPTGVSDPDPLCFANPPVRPSADVAQSSPIGSPGGVYRPEWGVTNGSLLDTPEACQDLVDHVAPSGYFSELRHMRNENFLGQYNVNLARQVALGSQLRLRFEQEAKLLRKSVAHVARRDKRIEARELEIKNLEALLETEAEMKRVAEDKSVGLIKELEDMRARFLDLQVSHEHLSQQVASLKEQVSGEEKLKAVCEEFKQYEDERVERRCAELDARLDALSIDFDEKLYPHMLTAIAGRKWVVGHGLRLAMMKSLQSLKDLKYHLLDQLEGLKDAPMDIIMAALYLESDTGGDAPKYIRDLRPSSSQLTIPVYPEIRDPRNPWAYKEEMKLSDAISANISRAQKKKKCRIVCRTHGVGSAHHARSDGVLVSVPTVVPQGLALLLVDAATQTDLEDLVL
nr:protein nuclear fusion defective 4-like [Tanacetum cinerariifolium]